MWNRGTGVVAALGGAALLALLMAGCGPTMVGETAIGDLATAPDRYENERVRVRGQVAERPPALPPGAFLIRDGTGTLMVVTEWAGAPPVGTTVEVDGRYRSYPSWDRLEANRLTEGWR